MGLTVHLILLACVFLLPENKIYSTIITISIPVFAIYLPLTVLTGLLMVQQHNNFLNKRTRETLSESERRYFEILNSSNLFSVLLDEKGNITFCNIHLRRLTGYTKEELIGHNCFDIFLSDSTRSEIKEVFLAYN